MVPGPVAIEVPDLPNANRGDTPEQGGVGRVTLPPDKPVDTANKVIERIKKRLKDKPACKALFDKLDSEGVLANSLSIDTKDSAGRKFNSERMAALAVSDHDSNGKRLARGTITLNPKSFFFSGTISGQNIGDFLSSEVREKNGIGNLNFEQYRELIVLHEWMHLNDAAGIYDDLTKGANPALNKLIREKRF